MKIAPLMQVYKEHSPIKPLLVHTGQHYDTNMSEMFFTDLAIPRPDIFLNIGSDTHAGQVAKIMIAFEEVCKKEKPDAILVVGDVNSTMACSLVAVKLGIKILHLEAGLRSNDRSMPEEINRIVTDSIADVLLTPSPDADANLLKEGIDKCKIFRVGNIMIDSLMTFLPVAEGSSILERLKIESGGYALVTMHRPSNVDNHGMLMDILFSLEKIAENIPVVFPVHPRTKKIISENGMDGGLDKLIFTDPLGYLDFQKLMSNAKFVITDSGGIQEETTVLKIPCITLRENTERPVTITEGTNELVGTDIEKLNFFAAKAMTGQWKQSRIPEFWDGMTAHRVVDVMQRIGYF